MNRHSHTSGLARAAGRRALRSGLWVAVLALLAGCASMPKVPPGTEADRMQAAREALEQGNTAETLVIVRQLLADRPGSRFADEAIYLAGRAMYEDGDFLEAEDRFRRVLREYPESPFAADASYYLALALLSQSRPAALDQTETLAALTQFRSYLSRNPNGEHAERARGHIEDIRDKLAEKAYKNGALYDKLGDERAARFYYQDRVLAEYRDTGWAQKAMLKLARSYQETRDWAEAADWAQKLLDNGPDRDQEREAREVLETARRHGAAPGAETPAKAGAEQPAGSP